MDGYISPMFMEPSIDGYATDDWMLISSRPTRSYGPTIKAGPGNPTYPKPFKNR